MSLNIELHGIVTENKVQSPKKTIRLHFISRSMKSKKYNG